MRRQNIVEKMTTLLEGRKLNLLKDTQISKKDHNQGVIYRKGSYKLILDPDGWFGVYRADDVVLQGELGGGGPPFDFIIDDRGREIKLQSAQDVVEYAIKNNR